MSSSYIGAEPLDTYASLAVQHFTTSATTSYSLSQSVTSENDIRLTINSVVQQPGSSYAYTCSGTTLTLSSATSSSDTMHCVFIGKSIGTINPPDGSVDSATVVSGAIDDSHISGLAASKLTGVVAPANLGTGTASSSTFLNGAGAYAEAGGGKVLQVVTTQLTTSTSGTSQNAWTDTGITLAITPTASDSTILLTAMFVLFWSNTTGDSGMSVRFKQAIAGGATSYPEGLSSGTNGNYHTLFYHTPAIAGNNLDNCFFQGSSSPSTTSAITYTMQYGSYNIEAGGVGGASDKPRLTLMEIGA